ncbi:MAG: HD domain-containing phosphohydrolase [Deltaproteobacteria bacterium]
MANVNKKKILFVDDEESILDVASEYFSIKGYQVFTARNGDEALSVLEKEQIDCCFTDINMPVMDGLELAENINKRDNTIPVVIMTGYPSLENTIRTLKNGVVDFLIKPINLNQLELCLKRVLNQQHLYVENILLKKEIESKARIESLNQELFQKIEDLQTLNHIMNDFSSVTSSAAVFSRLVQMANEIAHANESVFYIINEAITVPFAVAAASTAADGAVVSPIDLVNISSRIPNTIIMDVASNPLPLLISESNLLHGFSETIESVMIAPLTIRKKIFGILSTINLKGHNRFTEKNLYYLSFMTQHAAYAIENLALYENIYQNLFSTIYAFVKAIGAKDSYTEQHSNRVTSVAKVLAHEMGCSVEELDILNTAGLLHDIGKIGIRDEILLKPGKLTNEEYEIIKTHSVIGANIVGQLGLWEREQQIIRCHHERYDGTGYPDRLKGADIPFLARILSVADVYDALASDRTYRSRMDAAQILEIIQRGKGSFFDPDVVDTFMNAYQTGKICEAFQCVACMDCQTA